MPVTREQAAEAMQQLAAQLNRMGPALAAELGVGSVTFEVGTDVEVPGPYWAAIIRKGTTVHRAGPDGYTDGCRRSMRTGARLTRAEVDAIDGRTWCLRCGGGPNA